MAEDVPLWDDQSDEENRELLPYDGSARLSLPFSARGAEQIFETLLAAVPWQQRQVHVFGRAVDQPRLTAWFGDPGRRYQYSGLALEPEPWSPTLSELKAVAESTAGCAFNSALANLYRTGADGVAWHSDDEPELGSEPVICSLSFGARRRFDLRHKESGQTIRCELPSGSALVMSGPSQRYWRHQVPKTKRNVGARINVTFRSIDG